MEASEQDVKSRGKPFFNIYPQALEWKTGCVFHVRPKIARLLQASENPVVATEPGKVFPDIHAPVPIPEFNLDSDLSEKVVDRIRIRRSKKFDRNSWTKLLNEIGGVV